MREKSGTSPRLALLLLIFIAAVNADELDAHYFDIAPQSMDTALIEFSEQANMQLMVSSDVVKNLKTLGVRGRFDSEVALTVLLSGTKLTFHVVGDNAIVVVRESRE